MGRDIMENAKRKRRGGMATEGLLQRTQEYTRRQRKDGRKATLWPEPTASDALDRRVLGTEMWGPKA